MLLMLQEIKETKNKRMIALKSDVFTFPAHLFSNNKGEFHFACYFAQLSVVLSVPIQMVNMLNCFINVLLARE